MYLYYMAKNAHMHGPHSIMPGGGYTHTPIAMGLYKMCVGCVKAGPVILVCGVSKQQSLFHRCVWRVKTCSVVCKATEAWSP